MVATTKKKPSKRNRYDWHKIQIDFFKSEYVEVAPFLKEKYGIDVNHNGVAQRTVKGWKDQKIELKRESVEQAKKKFVEVYAPGLEELGQMHKATISIMKATLQHVLEDCIDPATGKAKKGADMAVVEKIWKIIKAEKLEPTAVQKNENSLSSEDRDLLSALLDREFGDDDDDDE